MEASGAGRLLLSSYGALMRYEVQPGEIRVVGGPCPHPLPRSFLCRLCVVWFLGAHFLQGGTLLDPDVAFGCVLTQTPKLDQMLPAVGFWRHASTMEKECDDTVF